MNIRLEYNRGWDTYFKYNIVNLFILISVLLVSIIIFTQEYHSDFISILRISRHGRLMTAIAKLLTLCICVLILVILFTLETWGIGITLGYSSPNNALQVFTDYRFSPYIITIAQYFLIVTLIKILAATTFGMLIMTISVFISDYSLLMGCGMGIIGINYLLYFLPYENFENPLNMLNLINVLEVNSMYKRFTAINFFDKPIECWHFMIVFYYILFAISTVIVCLRSKNLRATSIFLDNSMIHSIPSVALKKSIRLQFPKRIINTSALSLVWYESYKLLISSKMIFIFILLFIVKLCLSNSCNQINITYTDALYYEYMTYLSGESTDEKTKYIIDELTKMTSVMEKQETMYKAYKNEEIPYDKYITYIEELNYALSRKDFFEEKIYKHYEYIIEMSDNEKEAYYVYDTGWKKLLFQDFDWSLYIAILLSSGLFLQEFYHKSSSGSFANIMRTTKKGRRETMYSKYSTNMILSVIIVVIWHLVDIFYILSRYELPLASAPVYSIREFANCSFEFSLVQCTVMVYLIRILIWVLLSRFICSISVIFRESIPLYTIISIVTILPGVLNELSVYSMKYFDFMSFSKVTDMYLLSEIVFLLYFMIFIVVVSLARICAQKKWC